MVATVSISARDESDGLQSSHEALLEVTPVPSDALFVVPGDEIPVDMDSGFLKGHGTQLVDGKLLATTCGIVVRINKLVTVRPLKSRYTAETGDVVVGRVTEVAGKVWKVDINSKQAAVLMLSAVSLPGGEQRRRTNLDELNMRSLFEENDLISAEVQSQNSSGAVMLHTRSNKYGKLERGQLVKVPPALIKRLKHHFHPVPEYSAELVLGCNGFVWVHERKAGADSAEGGDDAGAAPMQQDDAGWGKESEKAPVDAETREKLCRLANAVRVLASLFLTVAPAAIVAVADVSIAEGVALKDMLGKPFRDRIVEREVELRNAAAMMDTA